MDRIAQLQEFLKESPNDCFLKHALAMENLKLGKLTEARCLLEENREYDPNYIATYYHLGTIIGKVRTRKRSSDYI